MSLPEHICKEDIYCTCYQLALEPDEDCALHGNPYPPRCNCGRFIKRKQ